ncbi:RICIN domain-containing protein [Streptomyces sp. 891-h]|uniref:RICIN domain-containing protein n=1 Tax=Streptomyces sp. 891-h TaxID=2720714 RepID=UPI001FAA223C|nr:RICIN domain-containing protein [Streptomyces sp. 891-h]UNZ16799.1 RICIN domain-containing protein [Streptomyces sp. 891-h]
MPKKRRVLLSATALLGLAATGLATSVPGASADDRAAAADTVIVHSAKNSRLVMDVQGASKANGARIILYPRHGAANQRWQIVPGQGDWFQLRSVNSGRCLVNAYHSVQNGHGLTQMGCNSSYEDQFWARVPVGNGDKFTLVNKYSGKCADQTLDGRPRTQVIQWTCHGLSHQLWTAEKA